MPRPSSPDPGASRCRAAAFSASSSASSPRFLKYLPFDAFGKLFALLGIPEPMHLITVAERKSRGLQSIPVTLYQVDGRSHVIDVYPSKGWSSDVRVHGTGTLTTGTRTRTSRSPR